MPKRKQKKYTRPRKLFDKVRIEEENVLIRKYGLKNKREIWKAESAVDKIRGQAKLLLTKTAEEQKKFIEKLKKQGFQINNVADVLAINKEDYLKRRLQSVIVEKKLCTTPKQARQFITHKHVAVDNKIVNIPSYLIPVDEENKITLKLVKKIKGEKENKLEQQSGGKENA